MNGKLRKAYVRAMAAKKAFHTELQRVISGKELRGKKLAALAKANQRADKAFVEISRYHVRRHAR